MNGFEWFLCTAKWFVCTEEWIHEWIRVICVYRKSALYRGGSMCKVLLHGAGSTQKHFWCVEFVMRGYVVANCASIPSQYLATIEYLNSWLAFSTLLIIVQVAQSWVSAYCICKSFRLSFQGLRYPGKVNKIQSRFVCVVCLLEWIEWSKWMPRLVWF